MHLGTDQARNRYDIHRHGRVRLRPTRSYVHRPEERAQARYAVTHWTMKACLSLECPYPLIIKTGVVV